MNLKNLLKSLKLNESTISMLLGAIVIVVIGVMIVNFFGGSGDGQAIPAIETGDESILPTTYQVAQGDDLWKISERFYGTGYNWTDIAQANQITDPNQISEGQELTIPDVDPRSLDEQSPTPTQPDAASDEMVDDESVMDEADTIASISPTPTQEADVMVETDELISGATYTVVHGDTLWDIAVRAYGDGYRWTDIAQENDLVNPNLIHAGNVFVLPR